MDNCSQHKKEVAGISDMKVLAEMIGDLHYESLAELLTHLAEKIRQDGLRDFHSGKTDLSGQLFQGKMNIWSAAQAIKRAWQISKPFMNQTT